MAVAHVNDSPPPLHSNWTERVQRIMEPVKADARQLWLPVTTVLAIVLFIGGATVGGAIAVGRWIERSTHQEGTVSSVAGELKTLNTQIATMQGSINALMGMQAKLAETSAEIGGLRGDIEDLEREHRLLKDFVEGRIGSLPYRPSTAERGSP